jgi:hypothetical protein
MKRLSEGWLRFNKETWANIPESGWMRFVQSWPADDREKLQNLLKETRDLIAEVAGTARARQQALEALLNKVESP